MIWTTEEQIAIKIMSKTRQPHGYVSLSSLETPVAAHFKYDYRKMLAFCEKCKEADIIKSFLGFVTSDGNYLCPTNATLSKYSSFEQLEISFN